MSGAQAYSTSIKLWVITNKKGEVIGTGRIVESKDTNAPSGGWPVPAEGQRIHEITLPPELHHIRSAQELHREVSKLIEQADQEAAALSSDRERG